MKSIKKLFNVIVYLAILISVVSFSLSTFDTINKNIGSILNMVEFVCIGIFILEFGILSIVKRFKYIFSLECIVDLMVIIPFFFGSNVAFLRLFRFLRILKLLKTAKLSAAMTRMKIALLDVKQELYLFYIITGFVIFFSGAGVYVFEHEAQPENFKSIADGLWWAVATMTTIGYGDIFPVTAMGKIFTVIVVLSSLGIVAVPSGLIASALTKN